MGVLWILWPEVELSLLVEIPLFLSHEHFFLQERGGKRLPEQDPLTGE